MAKQYFNRYIWIIDTIRKNKYITFSELQAAWENSSLNEDGKPLAQRTFFNHRSAILDMFGIDIVFDKQKGYYIDEASDPEGTRQWLLSALAVNRMRTEFADMKKQVLLENAPIGEEFLGTFAEALRNKQVLKMSYQHFLDDNAHEVLLSPYCIRLWKRRWYVLGKVDYTEHFRIFAFDRIQSLELTKKHYKMPEDFDAQDFFAPFYGMMSSDEPQVQFVEIKVIDEQRGYIRALPLHPSQQEIKTTDEYSIFRYTMDPRPDFMMELLSMEDAVEVLKPKAFREEIAKQIKGMHALYK